MKEVGIVMVIKNVIRAIGILVVAETEGIEDTIHTMNQFIDESFNVEKDRRFMVTGYAGKPRGGLSRICLWWKRQGSSAGKWYKVWNRKADRDSIKRSSIFNLP